MSEAYAVPPRRITVLLVDDEPIVREISRRILEEAGYRVYEAIDAPEAIAILATTGTVDIVVSDVRMPQDGYNLAAHVARQVPQPPIVFISGFDPRLEELGALGPLLRKPFTGSELLETVRQVLARSA